MKILYISQYFPPEMGAPSARVSELSRHWVQAGHKVTVLTGFPNHPDGVIRPDYRKQFRRGIWREEIDGINVVRTWLLPFPNRKPYERMLNYSSFCASASLTGSFLNSPDVVIATSPQLLVGLAGYWIAKLKRVPFVLEVRDLWPESLAAVGMGGADSKLHRAIDKMSVIQNGVETALFAQRRSGPEIRAALSAKRKFMVSFIGTIGLAHGLDTLILAAQRLQREAPDVLFLLLGEGADRERIQQQAQSKNLDNIRFIPQQPRERIPDYICASDACLVLLRKSEVFETVIPTKMLEFMSCARPVILGVEGQARDILEKAQAGVCCEPGNHDALCRAILLLKQNREMGEALGRNGRKYILQNLSRQKTAAAYLLVLSNLLKRNVQIGSALAA
ncbi:MAG: glycosyltransferase WbuB [Acidobacteria bacterium]|nr:MAG: glycosyltransferase WbuB [Acidobacteriota bacterium]